MEMEYLFLGWKHIGAYISFKYHSTEDKKTLKVENISIKRKKIEHNSTWKLTCCNCGQPRREGQLLLCPSLGPAPSVQLAHLPQSYLLLWGVSLVLNQFTEPVPALTRHLLAVYHNQAVHDRKWRRGDCLFWWQPAVRPSSTWYKSHCKQEYTKGRGKLPASKEIS